MPKFTFRRNQPKNHKHNLEPRNLVMEKETYDYYKQQDRQEEKLFIQHLVAGVER